MREAKQRGITVTPTYVDQAEMCKEGRQLGRIVCHEMKQQCQCRDTALSLLYIYISPVLQWRDQDSLRLAISWTLMLFTPWSPANWQSMEKDY
jgi:hypothetical protein